MGGQLKQDYACGTAARSRVTVAPPHARLARLAEVALRSPDTFTAISLTSGISFGDGRIKEFHFLMRDFPAQFGSFAVLAIVCWVGYYSIRRRLRTPRPNRE
jgi:hypothetical protein